MGGIVNSIARFPFFGGTFIITVELLLLYAIFWYNQRHTDAAAASATVVDVVPTETEPTHWAFGARLELPLLHSTILET